MFNDLSKRHNIEYTDFRYMDFCVDNKLYLKIMLFLDVNQISFLSNLLNINPSYKEEIYFICFEDNEKYLKELIKDCNTIIIDKSTIEEYLEKDYIEIDGVKIDYRTE